MTSLSGLLHHKLSVLAGTVITLWIVGTFLIHYFERAQGWSYFDAFYFTVITTATIGFGDLTPYSLGGRVVTMVYSVTFVPLFLTTMNHILEHRINRLSREESRTRKHLGQLLIQQEELLTKENTEAIMEEKG